MKKLLFVLAVSSVGMYASTTCPLTFVNNVTLTAGTNYADNTDTCSDGGYTFSNFDIYSHLGNANVNNFSATVNIVNGELSLNYTNILTDDIVFFYDITGGISGMTAEVGSATAITEVVCGTAFDDANGNTTCGSGALNTQPLIVSQTNPIATSPVNAAATDYIAKDITGGSELFQQIVPEPMTLSLMGAGLLGLGLLRRRRQK